MNQLINILIVDDSADDVEFTLAALQGTKLANAISVVNDGVEAMEYLRREGKYASASKPSLVFLDLNMPRKDGREVLAEMKEDPELRQIPVVILTTSQTEEDILRSYDLHANCYISKPVDLQGLSKIVQTIDEFWFGVVKLPPAR
ncbi:MAG: response regulator [Candidatus Obscuribacterales bacterium]|nr:response regulator [Candidatus Obscuribacterales bacterium]